MTTSDQLYYSSASSEIEYGLTPSHILNVDRLLCALAPWEKREGLALKKKTLIVNASDLSAITPIENEIIIKERLEALAQKGFDIYVYFNGQLHLWSDIKYSDISNDNKQAEIRDTAKQLALSVDELLILDSKILTDLIKGDDEDWEAYRQATEVKLHQSNLSSKSLTALLDARQEEITALTLSECLNLEDYTPSTELILPKLKTLIFKNSTSDSRRPVSIGPKTLLARDIISSLMRKATLLSGLGLAGCEQVHGDILDEIPYPEHLEELGLSCCPINPESLTKVLIAMRQIKALNLIGHTNLNEIIPDQLNTQEIEQLYLDDPYINEDKIHILLQHSQKLKILHLANNKRIANWGSFARNLASLEELQLMCSDISIQALEQLLESAAQLKKLTLYNCSNLNGTIIQEMNLGSLEELYLRDSNITTQALEQLIKNAPRLKILNLYNCSNLNGAIINDLNIGSLEELVLINSNISTQALEQLIKSAPKLKSLYLNGCRNLDGPLSKALKLNSLNYLDLRGSNIATGALEQLLESAHQLQRLLLDDSTDLKSPITKELKLYSLNDLWIKSSNITSKALEQLLKNAPQLKSLLLFDCNNLESATTKALNISSLEHLSLFGSSISSEALEQLLKNASNLKSLSLGDLKNLNDCITADLNLRSLEQLNLCCCNISIEALEQLLHNAPQLKKLELHQCTDLNKKSMDWIIAKYPRLIITRNDSSKVNKASVSVDADTRLNPKNGLAAHTLFYSQNMDAVPPVNDYRLNIYNTLRLETESCNIQNPFTLGSKRGFWDIKIPPQKTAYDTWLTPPKKGCFYGRQKLNLNSQWQPLASLSSNETLLQYHLSEDLTHELLYSNDENLYYIRLLSPPSNLKRTLRIDFILQTQATSSPKPLPEDIQAKILACRAFKTGALQGIGATATGAEYIAALETQALGACRHRAVVFMHWMKKNHPTIMVRVVYNDVHAFIELYYDKQWQRIDLGGYPSKLYLSNPNPPPDIIPQARLEHLQLNSAGSIARSYFPMPEAEPTPRSSMEYIERLLALGHKKMLLDVKESDIAPLRRVIQQIRGKRPCWYIHSPEDLITSAPFIERQLQADGRYTGVLRKGPGGAFYDFLKAHEHDAPLIIVNYAQFSPADIVRFNALLDPIREADGTKLPEKTIVLGLSDLSKPGAYDGADFLSRFDRTPINCPLSSAQLPSPIEIQQQGDIPADCVIDLLGGSHWEEQLLGSWSLSGQELTFVPGALIEALISNPAKTHIELRNAPWDNKNFARFWQDTLSSRMLRSRYDTLELPQGFSITKSQGYDWALLTQRLQPALEPLITPEHQMLNPGNLSLFLGAYSCDNETHTVTRSEGLLKASAGQTLPVYLSAPLSDSDWAKLLTECAAYEVTLNLHKAPSLPLPRAWDAHKIIPESRLSEAAPWRACTQNKDCIVQSTDNDLTRRQLNSDNRVEIEASELDSEHLLTQIQAFFDKEQLRFSFTQSEGALLCALAQNKTVVLHGTIKPSLWDALNQLMMKRQQQDSSTRQGVLIILGTPPLPQTHLPLFEHQVSLAEKAAALSTEGLESDILEDKPYTQLRAEAAQKLRPSSHPNSTPWQGIHTLPPESRPSGSVDLSTDAANAMNTQRMTAVFETLANAPFVLLSGKTGVGKSSFIPEWRKAHPAVYMGESALLDWATDNSPGIKTLFIDEANISGSDWSLFEGLFNTNPGILIGNVYYPLSKNHKIIFAANPMSYGGERRLPALFERHGNSVIFEPMTQAFLYQKVLAPLLNNQEDLAKPLLDMAQFFTSCNPNAVLISPRELEMMALLAMNYCKRTPDAKPLEVVNYYAYTLGKTLVPKEKSAQFEALFKTDELAHVHLAVRGLCLTQSNQPAHQALNDLLELRKARQVGSMPSTGGLGGLIIEGEPGVGKSELVIKTLLAQGLAKANNQHEHPNGNMFYVLPPSYSYKDKEALLLKAFHEGAVVVIDEINSSHMMERLLNALLMGATLKGEPATKPGFMIVGTQNPISMAGRIKASNALQRRTQKVIIPEYSKEEMSVILQAKGLDSTRTEELIDDYNRVKKPQKLCLRDLVKRAEELVSARQHTEAHGAGLRFFRGVMDEEKVPEEKSANRVYTQAP